MAITGIVASRPKIVKGRVTNEIEKYIYANYIKSLEDKYKETLITEEDKKQIIELSKRDDLLDVFIKSFAPHIAGYEDVKKVLGDVK